MDEALGGQHCPHTDRLHGLCPSVCKTEVRARSTERMAGNPPNNRESLLTEASVPIKNSQSYGTPATLPASLHGEASSPSSVAKILVI